MCRNKCIAKIIIKLKNHEVVTIESLDKNVLFSGMIVGQFRDKLPCFLPGTLVNTPNGQITIEDLKENSVIYNDNGDEAIIEKVHFWTTNNLQKEQYLILFQKTH